MSNILPGLLLQIALIASNAFFAMSEFAVVSANAQKMKHLAAEGDRRAKRLLVIMDAPSDFLAAIQIGVTLSGFMASAAAAESFAAPLVSLLGFIPIPQATLHGIMVVLITLLLSYFMLIFGELAPKRIAMKNPDGVALHVVNIIWVFYKICSPVIHLIAASLNLVLRPLGIGPEGDEEAVGEDDIMMMVEAGEETGTVDEHEHEMIKNIFELDDRKVSEIMTHRTDVAGVPVTGTLKDIMEIQNENRFSRIPVYRDDLDNIVGAVFVKDILHLLDPAENENVSPEELMRSVLYIPESMTCSDLLHAFQKKHVHMAIVVDEYGGTEGMVTMEDLLETIVGCLDDENREETLVSAVSEGVYEADGCAGADELDDILGEEFFEETDCETIGGFVAATLGHIPQAGETILAGKKECTITVTEATPRTVARVLIKVPDDIAMKTGDDEHLQHGAKKIKSSQGKENKDHKTKEK